MKKIIALVERFGLSTTGMHDFNRVGVVGAVEE